MKIFIVNVVCGKGSTGRIVADLYHKITKAGHDALIAYGRGGAPKSVKSYRIGNECDVLFHAGLSRLTDGQGEYSKRPTKKLINVIREYAPDIIHLHNIHGYYLNYEILFDFLKSYHRPVVWTMHDCWAFTGHCAHYEGVGCDGWLTGCKNCKALFLYPKAYIGRYTAAHYDRKKTAFVLPQLQIVAPSQWLKTQLSQSFFKDIPCTVIYNGIDLSVFKDEGNHIKEQLHISNKKMILGVANIWTKFKGLDDFSELSRRLDSRYVICMIGLSKKQLKKLAPGIIGIERTESAKALAQYYAAADVFLNLTYEDTFPTTNIEALACGTPVVTYQTGGSAEILSGGCGEVVPRANLDEVVRILEEKFQAKDIYKEACAKRAKRFDKEKTYCKYLELYDEIIGR